MFELKPGEYVDITKYPVEKRMQMFTELPCQFVTEKFCIAVRYSSGRYDTFQNRVDYRETWKHILKDFKEVRAGVNNLGRM